MTQATLSARLSGAAVSPGAGGGADSLLEEPEHDGKKKLRVFEIWAGILETSPFKCATAKGSEGSSGKKTQNRN